MPTPGNECHQNLSFRNIFVHAEQHVILSNDLNVAGFAAYGNQWSSGPKLAEHAIG
jgi:hypothetical protein